MAEDEEEVEVKILFFLTIQLKSEFHFRSGIFFIEVTKNNYSKKLFWSEFFFLKMKNKLVEIYKII